jgi:hypothetical protein
MNKDLKDRINKYLLTEQDDMGAEGPDEELLNDIVEFILDLDEEQLDDDMLERYAEIVDALDVGDEGDMEESEGLSEVRLLKKTSMKQRRLGRMYFKKNKSKIMAKRKRLAKRVAALRKMGKGLGGKKLGMTKRVGT